MFRSVFTKILALILVFAAFSCLCACSAEPENAPVEVTATAAEAAEETTEETTAAATEAVTTQPRYTDSATPSGETDWDYMLNTNSKKFHFPNCPSVEQMNEENKQPFTGTREEAIAKGYDPCGNCKP